MEHNINDDKSSGKNIAINDRTIANIKRQLKNKKTQMLQDYNYIKKGVKNNKYLQVAIENYKLFFMNISCTKSSAMCKLCFFISIRIMTIT